jgi:hypothetical protein
MIAIGSSVFMFGDGATFIASSVSGACTCGRAAHLFVSRNGKSLCMLCDGRRLMVASTESDGSEGPISAKQSFQEAII